MGDSRDGFGLDLGGSFGGIPGGGQSSMESSIDALTTFMQQQRTNARGQEATKALKGVVDKIGRFDGKDITGFLRAYVYKMEVHHVPGNTTIATFFLAVIPEICDRM